MSKVQAASTSPQQYTNFSSPITHHPSLITHHWPHSLISISTPAGRFRRISALIVFWLGSRMSISRLCVRISNCSWESLSMNGDRMTHYFSILVGSGTGPATRAPVFSAVSTICAADWSRIL